MIDESKNNKRIAKNTLILYVRMLFVMLVTLYISRIVLKELGVVDYGIYNVVGGFVAMFSILSGSLSAAISRFITFELGKGNNERLIKIFSSAVTIQIVMALIVCILVEIVGVWFISNKMTIPEGRLDSAVWVLHCSVLTFAINLISVPYNAAIIAHERMKAFAYIGILEVVLKLGVSFLLCVAIIDVLKFYAVALLLVAIIIRMIYGVYCNRNFIECHYDYRNYDSTILKEMGAFAGWNMIGSSSAILREHGVNMVLNIFSGPAVNAARGIGHQVSTAFNSFVSNFFTALNPQITKTYAMGDKEYLMKLLFRGSRLSFFLLLILSLPALIETDVIMNIWLDNVPEHAITFARLFIIFVLSESLSGPLITAMLATGNIRNYQLVVGGLQLLNMPISYILMRMGMIPEVTVVVAILLSQCCLLARIVMLHNMIELSRRKFFINVWMKAIVVSLGAALIPCIVHFFLSISVWRFLLVSCVCILSSSLVVVLVGCNESERLFLRNKFIEIKNKL